MALNKVKLSAKKKRTEEVRKGERKIETRGGGEPPLSSNQTKPKLTTSRCSSPEKATLTSNDTTVRPCRAHAQ